MRLRQRLDVVVEPITLGEAKAALREYSDHEDGKITQLITAGRQWAEDYTSRSWAVQGYVVSYDGPPSKVALPYPPLASLDKVTYLLADGTEQQGSVNDWRVDLIGSTVTPVSVPETVTGYVLEYTAGAQIIPEAVKQAILLYVKAAYEDIPASEWQSGAERLIYPYKELGV